MSEARFRNPDLRQLHAAMIDAWRMAQASDRAAMLAGDRRPAMGDVWERAVGAGPPARQWPALEDAALEDAREAFVQALHLQRSARTLHKELKVAETALATEPTDENYRHASKSRRNFAMCRPRKR